MAKNTCNKNPGCRYFKNNNDCCQKRAFNTKSGGTKPDGTKPPVLDGGAKRTEKRPEPKESKPDGQKCPKPEGLN